MVSNPVSWLSSTRLFGTYCTDECACFVLEYLPRCDLATMLMHREALPAASARFYAAEVAVALTAMHDKGFAYRDVKSSALCMRL